MIYHTGFNIYVPCPKENIVITNIKKKLVNSSINRMTAIAAIYIF